MITALAQSWKMRTEKVRSFAQKDPVELFFSVSVKSQVFLETIQTLINCWFSLSNCLCLDLGIDIPDLDFYYSSFLRGRFFLSFLRGGFFLVCSRSAYTWW